MALSLFLERAGQVDHEPPLIILQETTSFFDHPGQNLGLVILSPFCRHLIGLVTSLFESQRPFLIFRQKILARLAFLNSWLIFSILLVKKI